MESDMVGEEEGEEDMMVVGIFLSEGMEKGK